MTDEERKALVERLLERRITIDVMPWMRPDALCVEAATQIEADGKRIAELKAALRDVIPPAHFGEDEQRKAYWANARAALGETK